MSLFDIFVDIAVGRLLGLYGELPQMKQDTSAPDRADLREENGLPDGAKVAELLSDVPRPFVIASDRELSVLRRGLTKEGWKRSLFLQDAPDDLTTLSGAGLLARANHWLATEIRIPEQGGSCGDFFCDDGSPLDVPEDILSQVREFRCSSCGVKVNGEKYGAAFRSLQHKALANGCLALSLVYQIDRDGEYADKAAEILLSYAKAYDDGGTVLRDPEDEARWVIPLAQAYDLIFHAKALVNGDKHPVEENILRPVADRLANSSASGSRNLWCTAAIGVIGAALKDADLVNLAVDRLLDQVTGEVGQDGMLRGSVYNHLDSLTALVQFAEACSRVGVDLYSANHAVGRLLKQMFLAPLGCVYPSFEIPAIKEGAYGSLLPVSIYEAAYRRWSDLSFAWVLKTTYNFGRQVAGGSNMSRRASLTRSSLYAFLFGRDLPGRVHEPKLESLDLPSCGLCTLRGDTGTMLTLDYGPFIQHGEMGKLGLTVFSDGSVVVPDYGLPGDGAKICGYLRSTISHNTVVVDGQSQAATSESNLNLLLTGTYLQMAEAYSTEAYPGVRHTRRAILADDVIVLVDSVESSDWHTYDWLFRSEGELLDIPPEVGPAEAVSDEFTSPRSLGTASSFAFRWDRGGLGLAAYLATDEPVELIAARCPAETAARSVPVVDLRRNGSSARYAAVFVPYRQSTPKIEQTGSTFKATVGDAIDWMHISGISENGASSSELETDAEIAAVRMVGGSVVACGLYKGSYVKLGGEMILLGARRFGRIEARFDSRNPIVNFEEASGDYLRLKCSSRAMRVNGHRISASNFDGMASIRLVGVLAGAR